MQHERRITGAGFSTDKILKITVHTVKLAFSAVLTMTKFNGTVL